jgi:hypothetical protein
MFCSDGATCQSLNLIALERTRGDRKGGSHIAPRGSPIISNNFPNPTAALTLDSCLLTLLHDNACGPGCAFIRAQGLRRRAGIHFHPYCGELGVAKTIMHWDGFIMSSDDDIVGNGHVELTRCRVRNTCAKWRVMVKIC